MIKTVFVSSTSKHKLAAVEQIISEIHPEGNFEIKGVPVTSCINEQPVGHKETLIGALNRLTTAKKIIGETEFEFIIAIENGIFPVEIENKTHWFDFGWVIVEDKWKNRAFTHSTSVEFDQAYVDETRKRGFDTTTVGSVMSDLTEADSTDPHSDLTNQQVSRTEILRQSLKVALSQLKERLLNQSRDV